MISYFDFIKQDDEDKYNMLLEACSHVARLQSSLVNIQSYVNFLVLFNQTIDGKFSVTPWGEEILTFVKEGLEYEEL
jgi:hypothetical protein